MLEIPRAGSRWRHWKGGDYEVITTECEEATGFVVVVYRSLKTTVTWTRPLGDFVGMVKQPDGPAVPRFVREDRP